MSELANPVQQFHILPDGQCREFAFLAWVSALLDEMPYLDKKTRKEYVTWQMEKSYPGQVLAPYVTIMAATAPWGIRIEAPKPGHGVMVTVQGGFPNENGELATWITDRSIDIPFARVRATLKPKNAALRLFDQVVTPTAALAGEVAEKVALYVKRINDSNAAKALLIKAGARQDETGYITINPHIEYNDGLTGKATVDFNNGTVNLGLRKVTAKVAGLIMQIIGDQTGVPGGDELTVMGGRWGGSMLVTMELPGLWPDTAARIVELVTDKTFSGPGVTNEVGSA